MDTGKACINDLNRDLYLIYGNSINAGNMFVGNALGVITVFASLSTNVVATVLIAYRAWYAAQINVPQGGDESSSRADDQRAPAHSHVVSESFLSTHPSPANTCAACRVRNSVFHPLGK